MFDENASRSWQPVSSFSNRVKQEERVNLTGTSPTFQPRTSPRPDDTAVHPESVTSTKKHYSEQQKKAIVQWHDAGHDEASIAELFQKEFPVGRKMTVSTVYACLRRWGKKGMVVEKNMGTTDRARSPSIELEAQPCMVNSNNSEPGTYPILELHRYD